MIASTSALTSARVWTPCAVPVSGNGLRPGETEVLRLIALGHTSARSRASFVSPAAPSTHRAWILRKLGLTRRVEPSSTRYDAT